MGARHGTPDPGRALLATTAVVTTRFERPRTVPGVAVALVVAATLAGLLAHGIATIAQARAGGGQMALTVIYGILLLAWFPLVRYPSARRRLAAGLAGIAALSAAAGSLAYSGTVSASYYWVAVLLLGLGGITQWLVRPAEPAIEPGSVPASPNVR